MAEDGEFTKPFSFTGFSDDTYFWSAHPIRVAAELALYNDGHFDFSYGPVSADAHAELKYSFLGEVGANGRSIYMDMYSFDRESWASVSAPYHSWHEDWSEGGAVSVTIATDSTVFEDLRIVPQITVKGAG